MLLWPAGGGEIPWSKNRKSLCPFVSFLHLIPQTLVDTFCYFITCVCVCVWDEVMRLNGSCSPDLSCFKMYWLQCFVLFFVLRQILPATLRSIFSGVFNFVHVYPSMCHLCLGWVCGYCWACRSLSRGAQISGFILGWAGMSFSLFWFWLTDAAAALALSQMSVNQNHGCNWSDVQNPENVKLFTKCT